MSNKTLRGNVDILIAVPEYADNPLAPEAAELNNTSYVTNISCAVNDEFTVNLTDPDTDESMSICDIAAVANPTYANYEVSLDIFRDADLTAVSGLFNKAAALFRHPYVEYYVIVRIGRAQGTAAGVDDIVSIFQVKTDYPVDILDAGSPMQLGARFKPLGAQNVEYKVVA